MSSELAAIFQEARPAASPADADGSSLGERLASMLASARAAWPGVVVADDDFVRQLAARAQPGLAPLEAAASVRSDDLYLAMACAASQPAALSAFESAFGPVIRAALGQLKLGDADRADLAQVLRERLFVGADAKIADYAGRGHLRGWVRAAATRTGLNFLESRRRETPLTDEVMRNLPTTGDPALDRLRDTYRADFQAALRTALQELPARERTLLAQAFVDGLNVDQLGAIHGVHRATAARWLVAAREGVLAATKATLRERLKVSRDELESIMRLIDSQLEMSVGALFAPALTK